MGCLNDNFYLIVLERVEGRFTVNSALYYESLDLIVLLRKAVSHREVIETNREGIHNASTVL